MDKSKGTIRQLRVFVQAESGEKHLVVCFEQDTVWQLKQRVFELTDVMPSLQQLFVVGKKETKELSNTKLLTKSKIKNGAQLSMRVDVPEELTLEHSSAAVASSVQGQLVSPRAMPPVSPRKPVSSVSVPRLAALAGLHAPSCFAFGVGLRQAIAGYQSTFCVFLCTQTGSQINAADVIAEGSAEVLISGTPADVLLTARPDGVLLVTYTPFSAVNDATIDVKVDGSSVNESPFPLVVRDLEAGAVALGKLLEQPAWAAPALELVAHLAETSGDIDVVFGKMSDPLVPFVALRAPALTPLNRLRTQKQLVRIYEGVLSEDANKSRLVREHALPLCGALLSSGVAVLSRELHMFVCRFGAVTQAPITSMVSQEEFLRVPAGMKGDDLAWRRVFSQCIAAVSPPDMTAALHTLIGLLPGTETAALELMERMGREGHWEAVLGVLPATSLLSRSLHVEPAATAFVLDAKRRGGPAVVERLHSCGLSLALVNALALVDVPPLWEPRVLEAFAPSTRPHQLRKEASQAMLRLLDCVGAMFEGEALSVKLLSALIGLVRSADLALGRAAFHVIQASALKFEETCRDIVVAEGVGALAELAMRCDQAGLALVDPVLDLVALVCRGTSTPNPVEAPVIPWLVARLKSGGGSKQASIITLIYFARIERYKSRVVASGGFDFLSELIRMVRSENVSILRRIPEESLELQKEIGSGACSRVWLARWDHKQVAVKMFNENYAAFSEKEFGSELAIMSVLRHPNICHAFGGSDTPGHRFLVMPIYRRGSLLDVIRNPDIPLSNFRILSMCVDAAVGMAFLHECGVLHRDLKSGNLLVDDNWRIAVVDFGISRMIDLSMSKKNIGTAIYSAPEVLCGKPYSFSADVFSFSFVIWELLSRQVPYKNHKQAFIINGVCNDNLRPPEPKDCPKALWMLIRQCWAQEASDRPTFASVVSTLKRLQSNVGALNSLKSVSKDNRMTMQMAKAFRSGGGAAGAATASEQSTPKEPLDRPSEGTKWATLGRNVPFPSLEEEDSGAGSSDNNMLM